MVINANTKTPTKVLLVSFVGAKYGGISQITRRKNGSFISEMPFPWTCSNFNKITYSGQL